MCYWINKHKNSIIAFLFVYIAIVVYMIINRKEITVSNGLSVFFSVFSINRNLFPVLVYVLSFPSFSVMDHYSYYENSFDYCLITRLSVRKYYVKSIICVILKSILLNCLLQVLLLKTIDLFWVKVSFSKMTVFNLISDNGWNNLVYYLVLSNIGAAIYSVFLFLCVPFFKSRYLYRSIPLLMILGGVLLGLLIFALSLPLTIIFHQPIARAVLLNSNPLGLLTPGLMMEENIMLSFIIAFIEITILIIVLFPLSIEKRMNDE